MTRRIIAFAAAAVTALAGSAACKTSGNSGNLDRTLIVGVDLPFQGVEADTSNATFNTMKIYLDSVGGKAGPYKVELKQYDDSIAASGGWDDAPCYDNADAHVANVDEVAVMGTLNSGCTKLEVPKLNLDPDGPMLMVSHASTNPGLTKKWQVGEPNKYYPTGKRNFARVITTDEYQGTAVARFAAKDLGVKKCAVLNDTEAYGQGVAMAFAAEAANQGITLLEHMAWDAKQPNYTALFTRIKAQNPDCVYLGGTFDNNGGQLVNDKVAVLGDNNAVKLIGPDGFTGFPDLEKLPQADGMYLTFAGMDQSQISQAGGTGAKLLSAYRAKYDADVPASYVMYGVLALQVILAAIAKSDGTRKGVRDAVFEGEGIRIPAGDAVLAKDVKIEPDSGDVNIVDISILRMENRKETFLKPYPVV